MAKPRRQNCKDCEAYLDDETYKKTSASGRCRPCYKTWYSKWCKERYEKGSVSQRAYYFCRNNAGAKLTTVILSEIMGRQGGRCKTCQDSLAVVKWEIDHIVPVSIGGTHEAANLQILCKRCNRAKDNGSMQDFADWVGRIAGRLLNDTTRDAGQNERTGQGPQE